MNFGDISGVSGVYWNVFWERFLSDFWEILGNFGGFFG